MSAFAITSDLNKIVLLSDGLSVYDDNEIASKAARKVFKVSESLGFVKLGLSGDFLGDIQGDAKKSGVTTPRELCHFLSDKLLEACKGHEKHLDKFPIAILCIGYTDTGIDVWKFYTYPHNNFTPVRETMYRPGHVLAATYSRPGNKCSFQRLFYKKYWPLYQPDIAHAAREAFKEMIDDYAAQGDPVGGQVFVETLRNPAG